MTSGRKVIDARNAPDGTVSHVLIEGNARFTSVENAMRIADAGGLSNAHSVHRANAKPHLRTNADGKERNNLDWLAED